MTQTLVQTFASIPEPIALLMLGAVMIALSVGFRARPGRKVAERNELPSPQAEPLRKTVAA